MEPSFKMNPGVKALWLDALRGDDYTQGQAQLATPEGEFCCLGVLCDLAVKNGVIPEPVVSEINGSGGRIGLLYGTPANDLYDRDNGLYLPKEVIEWSGVNRTGDREQDPESPSWVHRPPLSALNDEGKTFAEIADIIEAEF